MAGFVSKEVLPLAGRFCRRHSVTEPHDMLETTPQHAPGLHSMYAPLRNAMFDEKPIQERERMYGVRRACIKTIRTASTQQLSELEICAQRLADSDPLRAIDRL